MVQSERDTESESADLDKDEHAPEFDHDKEETTVIKDKLDQTGQALKEPQNAMASKL